MIVTPLSQRVLLKDEHKLQILLDLKQGKRFCVSDGMATISAAAPSFRVRCGACHHQKEPALFCKHCGEEIDVSRRNFARDKGGEAHTCEMCKKCGPKVCNDCGAMHPRSWKCKELLSLAVS